MVGIGIVFILKSHKHVQVFNYRRLLFKSELWRLWTNDKIYNWLPYGHTIKIR